MSEKSQRRLGILMQQQLSVFQLMRDLEEELPRRT
jgi:hypothetical protein